MWEKGKRKYWIFLPKVCFDFWIYPWWQDNARCDIALALLRVGLVEADHLLQGEDAEGTDEPLPKVGRMQNATQPERKVKEVSPVEDLHIKKIQMI